MKKIVIYRSGGHEELKLETCLDLVPTRTEVVVDVRAAGVNYADVIIRWGLYQSAKELVGWPITPGFEFSGVVREVGEDVTKFRKGDHVIGVSLFNAYASQVSVSEDYLYRMPEAMTFEEGGGFPAVFLTAYHALLQNVVIRPGMTALIHSAAGGVGSSLIQLCHVKGIKTIGVVGSPHKVGVLEQLGCNLVIDKSKEKLWNKVEACAPRGVDLAFDANGAETLKKSYDHLAPMGKLFFYGAHSMFPKSGGKVSWAKLLKDYVRIPRFNPLFMSAENKGLITFNLSFLFERKDLFSEAMNELLQWYGEKKIKIPNVTTFKLEDVGLAHKALESGKTTGKLVLLP